MIEHYYGAMGARETIEMEDENKPKEKCYICENLFTKSRVFYYHIEEKEIIFCKMCRDELIDQMVDAEECRYFQED